MNKPLFVLKVYVPFDDTYETLSNLLATESYTKVFWRSIVPPHKIEYHFGPLNEKQVSRYKDFFREVYQDSKYKDYCRFEVEEYSDTKGG